jgi:hypothetical protein
MLTTRNSINKFCRRPIGAALRMGGNFSHSTAILAGENPLSIFGLARATF